MCGQLNGWQENAHAAKPDDLSLFPGTYMVEEENQLL